MNSHISLKPNLAQSETLCLTNANLVLENEVVRGSIVVENEVIADISQGTSAVPGAIDCGGAYVIPGLIELHTDNLERHIEPRPSVDWPHSAAILAHDGELASTGITTVFDAMRVGSIHDGKARYHKYARSLASEIIAMREAGALKISHFLHLRAEVCSETLLEELEEFGPDDRIGIVSMMDHTPGQRQFRKLDQLKTYVAKKRGMNDAEFEAHVENLKCLRAQYGEAHEAGTVAAANRLGAALASHDDTTADQVTQSKAHGVSFAEFPTTVEAAQACRDQGISIMMGAPNIIRGGSHSGNVSAMELARLDLLDILSSDYVPAALLMSAFRVAEEWDDVARAIRTVTQAPALATGLSDRGTLSIGKRADLVCVSGDAPTPVVRGVWSR
ncbi:MAG: alpha-D-ribose 1-methylphosphonate 5-triphosphate diphosphatase, partial [Rhodobacteraceae bacterium]|nr:alpha-D-ribose 1-methylphosphonate 5-triphosphate diphosphatase [Paracoccaceae bacterium]